MFFYGCNSYGVYPFVNLFKTPIYPTDFLFNQNPSLYSLEYFRKTTKVFLLCKIPKSFYAMKSYY